MNPPDWTLKLPDDFLIALSSKHANDFDARIRSSHRRIETWELFHPTRGLAVSGWYGDDKCASVAALAPLMQQFTAWRDGHRAVAEYEKPQ